MGERERQNLELLSTELELDAGLDVRTLDHNLSPIKSWALS